SNGTALVAAFVFSMWDFSNDAVFHTVNGAFWYREAGACFGVPSGNVYGWLLVTFIAFSGVSLVLKARTMDWPRLAADLLR
ncbi:MAG TPA: carotenoid biosynthesis protein, partial [Thermoleophilaceae bacterium]|nr:carotenoid biosynthesis protein [Thermoleophilaceae bacterium]